MDIGSIYPLYEEDFEENNNHIECDNKVLLSLCREALYLIAEKYSFGNKRVLIPAYTCDTVFLPFKYLGWDCIYYSINKNLRIDIDSIKKQNELYKPSVIIFHPYYGVDLNSSEIETLRTIKTNSNIIVEDLTQCIFSEKLYDFVDYYVGSYRKWFSIPDGGFIKAADGINNFDIPEDENQIFVAAERSAMFLRGCYFENGNQLYKDISRDLTKAADNYSIDKIEPHRMSEFSVNRLSQQNIRENISKRQDNYRYLFNNLIQKKIKFVTNDITTVTTAPLYFVLYTEERSKLQRLLAEQKIYAPVLWPVTYKEVLINETINYIYDNILAIPIDQRYGVDDMQRIVKIINSSQE